jgi:glycerol uptake facilitator protein
VLLYIAAQILGAILGAFLMWVVYRDHFNSTSDPDTQLAVFSTGPAIENAVFNLLSEIVGTFVLIFVLFYFTNAELGDQKTQIGLGSLGALPVAFVVWAIGLSLGGTTGYAINPARDLGPRIAHALLPIRDKGHSNWKYSWIPIAGPFIGSILAALLYLLLKA